MKSIEETKDPTSSNSVRAVITGKDGYADPGLKTSMPATDDIYTGHYECIVG